MGITAITANPFGGNGGNRCGLHSVWAGARHGQSPYLGYISATHKLHFIYRSHLFQPIFDLFLLYWNRMIIGL